MAPAKSSYMVEKRNKESKIDSKWPSRRAGWKKSLNISCGALTTTFISWQYLDFWSKRYEKWNFYQKIQSVVFIQDLLATTRSKKEKQKMFLLHFKSWFFRPDDKASKRSKESRRGWGRSNKRRKWRRVWRPFVVLSRSHSLWFLIVCGLVWNILNYSWTSSIVAL